MQPKGKLEIISHGPGAVAEKAVVSDRAIGFPSDGTEPSLALRGRNILSEIH